MPGINQLGGALTVSSAQRTAAPAENAQATPPQDATATQAAPSDAVQGVRASKKAQEQTSDPGSEKGRRQTRQFSGLARRSSARKVSPGGDDQAERREEAQEKTDARAEARAEARLRSRERLERALNGRDLFSPRPVAQQQGSGESSSS